MYFYYFFVFILISVLIFLIQFINYRKTIVREGFWRRRWRFRAPRFRWAEDIAKKAAAAAKRAAEAARKAAEEVARKARELAQQQRAVDGLVREIGRVGGKVNSINHELVRGANNTISAMDRLADNSSKQLSSVSNKLGNQLDPTKVFDDIKRNMRGKLTTFDMT